ncbi:MFS family permease [Anaerosolibacter carboniphilus]|uniref:MFS family permease n=1 Tax=Anaerosolibacter carboniphilus TaxID=1417629 RepID=A0A841KLT9_9FIRM|nr:MFS transporter [Anaerosolibacter carboniphilus]MBB6214211.1 MFS family permease [Anaerosolibacter carboniphilus]
MDTLIRSKRLNIYLMYLIVFFQGFVFYGPIATIYRQSRGISMYQIFLIESVFWILMIVLEIPWGYFADRFGYKKTLVISNVIFFISKIVFYKAFSFYMFVFERILLAIAISGLSGCDIALLYASSEDGESQKVFGIYNALATAGYLIASLMSTLIVEYSIDKTGFYTVFPYGIAIILTILIKDVQTNEKIKEKMGIKDSFKNIMHNKPIMILVISIAFVREVFQATSVFLNQLQYIRSGIDIRYFGILAVMIQIANLSSAKSHILSNKLEKNKSIEMLIICIMICCFLLIFTQSQIFSVILIMLISGSMSLINPIVLEIQNKAIITGDRATMLSIYAMAGNIVAAIINPLIGKAADISVQTAFGTCVLIVFCGYGLFLIYKMMNRNLKSLYIDQ